MPKTGIRCTKIRHIVYIVWALLILGTMLVNVQAQNDAPLGNFYTTGTITLTWNPISWSTHYQVQIADNIAFAGTLFMNEVVDATPLSVATPPLLSDTYYWHVRAMNAVGKWGAWSSADSFTIDLPLSTPVPISPTNGATLRGALVKYTWAKGGSTTTDYEIEIENGWIAPVTGTSYQYFDCLGACNWRVRAHDQSAGLWSDWSDWQVLTIHPPLPPVVPVVGPANHAVINTQNPTFLWDWPVYSDGFIYGSSTIQIQIDDNSDFSSPLCDNCILSPAVSNGHQAAKVYISHHQVGSLPLFILDLYPDGLYYWRIRVINLIGEAGAWTTRSYTLHDTFSDCTPIASGPSTYFISGSAAEGWPQITRADFSELNPGTGVVQTLTLTYFVKPYTSMSPPPLDPITDVTVDLITDHGLLSSHTLTLVSGDAFFGQWSGSWTLDGDTHCYTYVFAMNATNAVGSGSIELGVRND